MSATIGNAWVQRFTARVHHLGQQAASRYRNYVYTENDNADIFNFDRMGAKDMAEKTSRYVHTDLRDVAHSRRRAAERTFNFKEAVDRRDFARILQNATSNYQKAAVKAYGRKVDQIIAETVGSNTLTTDGAGSAVGFTAGGGTIIGDGTSKLTLDYLRQVGETFGKNEIGGEGEPEIYFAFNAAARRHLLEITEVTSSDYAVQKALATGELTEYMGMKFIRSEILPAQTPTGGQVAATSGLLTGVGCFAWHRDCIGLAIADNMFAQAGPNPERDWANEIYLETTMGAALIENEGVTIVDIVNS